MRVKIVAVGNSRGVRIPKALLEECEIGDAAELRVDKGRLILTPVRSDARAGWERAARAMRKSGDDELMLPEVLADDADLPW